MHKFRILLAEDESELNELICDRIAAISEGEIEFKVDSCLDGQSALELLKTESYNLLITDINMPKLNGDVLIQNKQKSKNALTPVIIISAFLSSELEKQLEAASSLNPLVVLKKPFGLEKLEFYIRSILK